MLLLSTEALTRAGTVTCPASVTTRRIKCCLSIPHHYLPMQSSDHYSPSCHIIGMLISFISTSDIRHHPCTPNAGGSTVVESGKMLHIRHKSRDIDNDSTAPGSYRSRLAVPRWVVGSGPSPKHCPACHARQSKGTSASVALVISTPRSAGDEQNCRLL